MSLVVRAQLRFLWRARGSMLSALLGMTIGVASVVGVHLLSAQVALRVGQQAQPVGDVDLYLQRESLSDGDYFQLRARWRAGELPRVAAMFPLIEGEVSLGDESYLLVGTDPLAAGRLQVTRVKTEVSSEGSAQNRSQLASFLVEDSVFLPGSLQGSASSGAQINVAEAHKVAGRISLGGRRVQVLSYSAPERVILADLPSARSILSVNEPTLRSRCG